jgi:catalase
MAKKPTSNTGKAPKKSGDAPLSAQSDSFRFNDEYGQAGNGGETHQVAGENHPILTTQQGAPVSDDQNSLKIGERGRQS